MAFTNSNDFITGRQSAPYPAGPEVVAQRFTLALTTGDLALNTIGQIGVLPAGCVPVGLLVDGTDMDSSTAAMILQLGILDAAGTAFSTAAADGGAAWGSTTAVNTAFQQQVLSQPMMTVTASNSERKIGVKVTTAPTTAVAGTLGVTLLYKAA
jgi:1,6-anhydro-N-acetylmuramate kinase